MSTRRRRHRITAGMSALLGIAVAIATNAWTAKWTWPLAGLMGFLTLLWICLEVWRSESANHMPSRAKTLDHECMVVALHRRGREVEIGIRMRIGDSSMQD
jgi:hypothetical protein